MIHSLLWFVGGACAYKLLSKLLRIGYAAHLIKDLQINALSLLLTAVEDIAFMRSFKYKRMSELGMADKEIEKFKVQDDIVFGEWKEKSIMRLHNSVSPVLRGAFSFQNWDQATKLLDSHYKKIIKQ